LSCVYRTGQCFGMEYLIDILSGKRTDRVRQWGHDCISTFGIGHELSTEGWRIVFRHLLALDYLVAGEDRAGGERIALQLTSAARSVLRGETRIKLRLSHHQPSSRCQAFSCEPQTKCGG